MWMYPGWIVSMSRDCAEILEVALLISADALWEDGFGVIFPALFGSATAFADNAGAIGLLASILVWVSSYTAYL